MPAASMYEKHGNGISSSKSSLYIKSLPTVSSIRNELEGIESFVSTNPTGKVLGQRFDEDVSTSGISYLYIANNCLTIDSATNILDNLGLRLLDCGSLIGNKETNLLTAPTSQKFLSLCTNLLESNVFSQTFKNLTTLRIHHSIITQDYFTSSTSSSEGQSFEIRKQGLKCKLDSTPIDIPGICHEFDSTCIDEAGTNTSVYPPTSACWENPDDLESNFLKNFFSNKIETNKTSIEVSEPAICDPHQIPKLQELIQPSSPASAVCYLPYDFELEDIPSPPVPLTSDSVPSVRQTSPYEYHVLTAQISQSPKATQEIISQITQHRQRVESRERNSPRLKPSMLHSLKKLILTNIPKKTKTRHIIDRVLLFLQECAEE